MAKYRNGSNIEKSHNGNITIIAKTGEWTEAGKEWLNSLESKKLRLPRKLKKRIKIIASKSKWILQQKQVNYFAGTYYKVQHRPKQNRTTKYKKL